MNYEERAKQIVREYVNEMLDKSDRVIDFNVYTTWKCKALLNWKFLISTDLPDGLYFELTFNGNEDVWYLDAYKKFENRVISK